MSSLSSWDCVFDMPGDVDLECISISSFEDKMAPPTAKASDWASRSESWEDDPKEEPPIFEDTTCSIGYWE